MFTSKVEEPKVSLLDCIGPAFYDMHWDVIEGNHTYYDLVGGRGSLKSSVAGIEIVLGVMQDSEANAVVYRKVADTIGDSVYEQICWAIDKLEVSSEWHCTTSPYRCIYKPTGQRIIFKGLDKAKKSKSIKVSRGYIKYLWFEEFDEYAGAEEIRTVQQSVLRGGDKFIVFKSMNPPKSKNSWANKAVEEDKLKPDVYVSETTYLQAPKEWLGQQFIDDAEWLKIMNRKAYEHEYLGIPVGLGSEVFDNVEAREMTDDEINSWDWIYRGIDWGWYPDPYHFGQMYYDSNHHDLYIWDEYRVNKTRNEDTCNHLKETRFLDINDRITADSSEMESIADYRSWGLNCHPAKKGPKSVGYGVKWLQSLNHIYIDPIRCPKTYEEFRDYEYELDPDGNPTGMLPDEDNHSIDMTRYAMERVWRKKGQ